MFKGLLSLFVSFFVHFQKLIRPYPGPLCPPPRYGLFTDKKIYTHFFLEIESMIAKTNFTLGPIEKSIVFVKL